MSLFNHKTLFSLCSLLSIFFVSDCLAQDTVFETDYSTPRTFDTSYECGGYGLQGETEWHNAADSVTSERAESSDGGNDGPCLTLTLDATKLDIPEETSYDFLGWGGGSVIELKEAFKDADLSGYTISFDAKVAGTETLANSKCFVKFMVDDDAVAKDDDKNKDIVLSLTRGQGDGTDTFSVTNEYKTFSFNLKDEMVADTGAAADLADYDVKHVSFVLQAQGKVSDVGKDADNVLYIDNVKLTKKTE